MPIEHFLFALGLDGKYYFLKSNGVNQLLSDTSIHYLRQKRRNNNEPYWLPTEQVVAIQYIVTVYDKQRREGIWNHTLLSPIDEYIRLTNPYRLFGKYFIIENKEIPQRLEPITIEE